MLLSSTNLLLPALLSLTTTALTPPWTSSNPTAYISIHQTLSTYPLAIDSKSFPLLSKIFTPTATANYQPPLGILNGTSEIEAVLAASLAAVTTQHALTTQVIDVTSETTANATTYFTATHFERGLNEGMVVYAYGKYLDELVCVAGKGQWGEECKWRIQNRVLEYMGPLIGNLSIFT